MTKFYCILFGAAFVLPGLIVGGGWLLDWWVSRRRVSWTADKRKGRSVEAIAGENYDAK